MAVKLNKEFFKRHYDKVIGGVVLTGLLVSLVYLSVHAAGSSEWKQSYLNEIGRLRPRHPAVERIDVEPFENLLASVDSPAMIAVYTNALLIPEARLLCPSCGKPIPLGTEVCSCGYAPPPPPKVDVDRDSDADGIPDEWELKYGMNPFDPADAHVDMDGDGFTNLEEYLAGTDPTDPASHPPYRDTLYLVEIEEKPLNVLFLGRTRDEEDVAEFQLRVGGVQGTVFGKVGDTIVPGLKITDYQVRREMRQRPGMPRPAEVDVDYLELHKGDTKIELEIRVPSGYREYFAQFSDRIDRGEYAVGLGETFDFRGSEYTLLGVNSEADTAELQDDEGVRFIVSGEMD